MRGTAQAARPAARDACSALCRMILGTRFHSPQDLSESSNPPDARRAGRRSRRNFSGDALVRHPPRARLCLRGLDGAVLLREAPAGRATRRSRGRVHGLRVLLRWLERRRLRRRARRRCRSGRRNPGAARPRRFGPPPQLLRRLLPEGSAAGRVLHPRHRSHRRTAARGAAGRRPCDAVPRAHRARRRVAWRATTVDRPRDLCPAADLSTRRAFHASRRDLSSPAAGST